MKKKAKKAKSKKAKKTKKIVKKPVKKKTSKSKPKKAARRASARESSSAAKKKPGASPPAAPPPPPGPYVGRVTHYFPHVNAGALLIEEGEVRVGDTLYFKGHTSDFKQAVHSLQISRIAVERAGTGDEVGIEVSRRVREGDKVYKVQ